MAEISAGGSRELSDLNPLFVGCEQCASGHTFGPAVREYYLMHFVLSGKGCYRTGGREYRLGKGESFLIRPGEVTQYQADEREPWHYIWIAFNGRLARDFHSLPVIGKPSPGIFYEIRRAMGIRELRRELLASLLFQLYCECFRGRTGERDYVKEVYDFICCNYMSDITVEGLADMVNLDRRYLSRRFKERFGVPVRQFLMEYRLEKAAEFLSRGFSVADTAEMAGYRDVCNFSKMFKKIRGKSPAEYKARRNR